MRGGVYTRRLIEYHRRDYSSNKLRFVQEGKTLYTGCSWKRSDLGGCGECRQKEGKTLDTVCSWKRSDLEGCGDYRQKEGKTYTGCSWKRSDL
jgi:hypothetical protein